MLANNAGLRCLTLRRLSLSHSISRGVGSGGDSSDGKSKLEALQDRIKSTQNFNKKIEKLDMLIEGQDEYKNERAEEKEFTWNPNSKKPHRNFKKVFGDGLRAAHFGEKPIGEWAIPDHPKDVKRDYLFEDVFQRNKWLKEYRIHQSMYDEQRFANFPIVIGTVHRRIAHDRVEVVVREADYLNVVTEFKTVNGLVYVRDDGQTRVGEFIHARLDNPEGEIYSHIYTRTIKMKGLAVCPLTGKRIQDNKLIGDPITLEQGRKMFDQIEDRVHNYKYRDDYNRDHTLYELSWKEKEISGAIAEGDRIDPILRKFAADKTLIRQRQRKERYSKFLTMDGKKRETHKNQNTSKDQLLRLKNEPTPKHAQELKNTYYEDI